MLALAKLIGVRGLVGLVAGLAIMGAWERLPWGYAGRAVHAEAESARKSKALLAASDALKTAAKVIRDRGAAITENAAQESQDATSTASFWKGQCRAAFDAGYASRRCDGPAPAGGVPDLREAWGAGRFQSPVRVPGKPLGED